MRTVLRGTAVFGDLLKKEQQHAAHCNRGDLDCKSKYEFLPTEPSDQEETSQATSEQRLRALWRVQSQQASMLPPTAGRHPLHMLLPEGRSHASERRKDAGNLPNKRQAGPASDLGIAGRRRAE